MRCSALLLDLTFALPFSLGLNEVVKALSASFHCGHSIIKCCPPHKRHMLDFKIYLLDLCAIGTLFLFKPFSLEAFREPFSDECFLFFVIFVEKSRSHSAYNCTY